MMSMNFFRYKNKSIGIHIISGFLFKFSKIDRNDMIYNQKFDQCFIFKVLKSVIFCVLIVEITFSALCM